ncbi:MAG TPA: AAA family ATPase [Burkholderiales bacterium]|nr:AAA family ATPase [Burkholderiales bacterium]
MTIDPTSTVTAGDGRDAAALADALRALPPEAAAAAQKVLERDFAKEPQHWRVFTLVDAYAPRPARQYVVTGLLKLPSLSIVYGPPGCLKTMLCIDLAADVAAGLPWLPPIPGKGTGSGRETTRAPVLWVDCDNGADDMHERIEAMGRVRNLPTDVPLYYVSMPTPWLDASDIDTPSFLELQTVAIERAARLIIVDNLGVVAGDVEENSAEMAGVLSVFRQLAEATGAAVVLVHHQRKQTGVTTRRGDTLRGHSSIEAALNLALLVEREEHSETVTVRATKVRGADVLPFGALFTWEHKPGTDELSQARFFGLEVEDTTSDRAIERAILEAVKGRQPVKKHDLVSAVKEQLPDVGLNRIRTAADWLAREGKVAMQPGKQGSKLYTLPSHAVMDLLDALDE